MSLKNDNQLRLEAESKNLLALAETCSNFSVETCDSSLREYRLGFHVQSISDFDTASGVSTPTDRQEVEIILPVDYPKDPPGIRWLSPIFHPNVSLSGYLDTNDIGLEWAAEMSLVLVCERLWDIARFAWVDLDSANNYGAKRKWNEGSFQVPTDPRPLRDDVAEKLANVINYRSNRTSDPPEYQILPANVEPEVAFSIQDSGQAPSEWIDPDLVEVVEPVGEGEDPETGTAIAGREKDVLSESDPPVETGDDESELFVIDESSSPSVPPVIKRTGDDDVFVIE